MNAEVFVELIPISICVFTFDNIMDWGDVNYTMQRNRKLTLSGPTFQQDKEGIFYFLSLDFNGEIVA